MFGPPGVGTPIAKSPVLSGIRAHVWPSTGEGTTTLTKGKKVTLMNTADGTRYQLILLSLS